MYKGNNVSYENLSESMKRKLNELESLIDEKANAEELDSLNDNVDELKTEVTEHLGDNTKHLQVGERDKLNSFMDDYNNHTNSHKLHNNFYVATYDLVTDTYNVDIPTITTLELGHRFTVRFKDKNKGSLVNLTVNGTDKAFIKSADGYALVGMRGDSIQDIIYNGSSYIALGSFSPTVINAYGATVYVNKNTGEDLPNMGNSSSFPYKTISYAISQNVKSFNAKEITINVAPGHYEETLTLSAIGAKIFISGSGTGDLPTTTATVIDKINISSCSEVFIQNLSVAKGIDASDVNKLSLALLTRASGATTDIPINFIYLRRCTQVYIMSSTITGHTTGSAISAENTANVVLDIVAGTNNKIGLYALASVIRKVSSNITGTTPQSVSSGAQIL